MEVRCHNCDARLSVPSAGPMKKTQCPNCGTMVLIPPARPLSADAEDPRDGKKESARLKRIFEPMPRSAAYAGGLLLVLLVSSPFWITFLSDALQHQSPYLGDSKIDTAATNAPPHGRDLTQFAQVQLDAHREDLEHRFGLTLQNTRGMRPEIYVGHNAGDVETIMATFYDGLLKEATLVMRERPATLDTIQQELLDQYGEPQTRTDETGPSIHSSLTGLHGIAGSDDLSSKLAGYPHRRALLWMDGKVRLDALIYSDDTGRSAVLQVHLAATDWLQANQSALRPVGLHP